MMLTIRPSNSKRHYHFDSSPCNHYEAFFTEKGETWFSSDPDRLLRATRRNTNYKGAVLVMPRYDNPSPPTNWKPSWA